MNLYSRKQKWKYFLAFVALIIVASTIWYASYIASKVQHEERQKIKLWSQAIKKKADLVKLTNQSFEALSENERENVELWVKAEKEFEKPLSDYSFALEIVKKNVDTIYKKDNIPLILTDENDTLISYVNLPEIDTYDKKISTSLKKKEEFSRLTVQGATGALQLLHIEKLNYDSLLIKKNNAIRQLLNEWKLVNEPIEIVYSKNKSQRVYYTNSYEFYDLQLKRDSLIRAFNNDLIKNSALVPVIFFDNESKEIIATNIPEANIKDEIKKIKKENDPINIDLGDGRQGVIYFHESLTLKQLRYFPYIMLGIITVFLFVAYLLFSTFRRAEQNQVWVGMAKETAHQLGTPLSSLMAWLEILKEQGVKEDSISEMNKDIQRLETITERFSKIGSDTKLKNENIVQVINEGINYLKNRISKKIEIDFILNDIDIDIAINKPLFDWVIENLTKNAVDAMQGEGKLSFSLETDENQVFIDISDTGKGIPGKDVNAIFEPGYTTKDRGWGLGLSLAKRIIEEHHQGKIYILKSELNKGTTFRITLPLNNLKSV